VQHLTAHFFPLLCLTPKFFEAARSGIATLPEGTDLRVRLAREGFADERLVYTLRTREMFVGVRS
jgi:hypothetical protein